MLRLVPAREIDGGGKLERFSDKPMCQYSFNGDSLHFPADTSGYPRVNMWPSIARSSMLKQQSSRRQGGSTDASATRKAQQAQKRFFFLTFATFGGHGNSQTMLIRRFSGRGGRVGLQQKLVQIKHRLGMCVARETNPRQHLEF